jgi:tRNA modification GTPase
MGGPEESAFAVLTPPGRGGIAVIRCVGPAAETALAQCFRQTQATRQPQGGMPTPPLRGHASPHTQHAHGKDAVGMPPPGCLGYGHIVDVEGRPIDEVILYHAKTGGMRESPAASAAGSAAEGSIFEINCHGGPAAVRAVCERLALAGLSEVDVDRLMQIEGLPRITRDARRALRHAFTPLAARILLYQLNGALGGAITEILAALGTGVSGPYLAPGEYIGGRTFAGAPTAPRGGSGDPPRTASYPGVLAAIDALLQRWRTCGRFLADPPRIAIAGRPNSGKSTLLNRLVGAERAITSAAPGTTRDYVEAEAALEGAPALLVDTAGLREPGGEIERQGIERAWLELSRAAVVVYLIDAGEGANPEDNATLQSLGDRALVVLSKIDAAGAEKGTAPFSQQREKGTAPFSALAISALTGEGMPALVAAVLEKLGWRAPLPGDAAPFTADQAAVLAAAREELAAGRVDEAAERLKALLA